MSMNSAVPFNKRSYSYKMVFEELIYSIETTKSWLVFSNTLDKMSVNKGFGGCWMSSKKWVSLFLKTLLLGCVVGMVIGIIVQWHTQMQGLYDGHISGFFINLMVIGVLGGLFSVISQMGFFFYLTLHRIALGIFRSHSRWGIVQWFLISVTFVDFIYLRYSAFGHGEGVGGYFIPPVILIIIALAVAEIKKRETNKIAYIPALFFMFVVTTLEWLPVLRQKETTMFWVMGLTLVVCNAYQMLKLHRLLRQVK